MPQAQQLSHRNLQETAIPYISFASPTLTDPHYVSGSKDILTSIKGYIERRPGFSAGLESSPTTFTSVQRVYLWSRWDGTFICMLNDISGGNSVVYKMIIGTDANFVSLFTDTGNTGVFDFVLSNNTVYFANGHAVKKWDPTNGLSNWGITAPASAPGSIGNNAGSTLSLQVGWKYVYCYYNSATGHLSSPSPISASTGVETVASVTLTVSASADAQVDKIKVFRTTDGGGGNYFEISNSPFSNTNQTVTDTTTDANLNVNSVAPTPSFNDPPPAWNALTYFHGRIWGSVNNKTWFTGFEEIQNGVPEECVPSGSAGNFWQFDQNVVANASVEDSLLVFCPGRIYTITGDTLDTFRRTLLSNRRGTRNRASVTTIGKMCAWFDSSNQVWATDGETLQELGQDIRTDLSGVSSSNVSLTAHASGMTHWLVVSTNANLFVYDLDADRWMPPWSVTSPYVFSGETSSGNYTLLASIGQKIYKLSSSTAFNDAGSSYSWVGITNLFNLVPDYGKRFSYIATGSYDEPSRLGTPWCIGIERNTNALSTVQTLTDDDPTIANAVWTDVTGNLVSVEKAFLRTQGTNLIQDAYELYKPAGRRMAVKMTGATADQYDKIYTFFLAYKETR